MTAETSFERLCETSISAKTDVSIAFKSAPRTGRFHQIRRHLLEAGLPIVGDFRYAGIERSFELGEILGTGTRMLLQAKKLTFSHPQTGELLEITAPEIRSFADAFLIYAEALVRSEASSHGSLLCCKFCLEVCLLLSLGIYLCLPRAQPHRRLLLQPAQQQVSLPWPPRGPCACPFFSVPARGVCDLLKV